jgi:hypothetical protein
MGKLKAGWLSAPSWTGVSEVSKLFAAVWRPTIIYSTQLLKLLVTAAAYFPAAVQTCLPRRKTISKSRIFMIRHVLISRDYSMAKKDIASILNVCSVVIHLLDNVPS